MKIIIIGVLLLGAFFSIGSSNKELTRIYNQGEMVEQKTPISVIPVKASALSALAFTPIINEINYNHTQRECLALNIYHEARNQSIKGQVAVGFVTLNRVKSDLYPDTICEVVTQAVYSNGELVPHKCQFSWWCDNLSDTPKNKTAWKHAQNVANSVLNNYNYSTYDITEGSLWYHATYVKPDWIKMFNKTVKVGDHIFYAPK